MIFDAAWRLRRRFTAAARAAPDGPLSAYYARGLADFAAPDGPLTALDLETDGLNPGKDAIIEVGAVDMALSGIDLSTAFRLRVRPRGALRGESVIVHRITDDAVAAAQEETSALATILPRLGGRILVAHFAQIEAAFLDAACRRTFGAPFVAPFICTFQLERRWFPKDRKTDAFRLGHLRSNYNLPLYAAHDGLIDAIACGEVLLAQVARRRAAGLKLADLLRR